MGPKPRPRRRGRCTDGAPLPHVGRGAGIALRPWPPPPSQALAFRFSEDQPREPDGVKFLGRRRGREGQTPRQGGKALRQGGTGQGVDEAGR